MKYIDAEKLIERLEEMKQAEYENCGGVNSKTGALQEVQELITSLQQEEPERICPRCVYYNRIDDMCECPHGGMEYFINENGVYKCNMFEKVEQQEQPEVDLEKEIDACWQNWLSPSNQKEVEGVLPKTEFAMYARHFYELGRTEK